MAMEQTEKPSRTAIAPRNGEAGRSIDLAGIDKKKFNVLIATQTVQIISPWHMARTSIVELSPDPNDGDVFRVGSVDANKGKKDQQGRYLPHRYEDRLCLTKPALLKLADAAGIVWNWRECKRMDNMSDRNYVAFQAVGGIRLPDGAVRVFRGSKEIDMEVIEAEIRDQWEKVGAAQASDSDGEGGGARKKELTPEERERKALSEILQYRKHKAARCETGAYNRVIRMLLSLKSTFSAAEIAKPFIVERIDFAPDYSNPETRRRVELAYISQVGSDFGMEAQETRALAGDACATVEDCRQAEQEVQARREDAGPKWDQAGEAVDAEYAEELPQGGEEEE
jgi:hypothetical protein